MSIMRFWAILGVLKVCLNDNEYPVGYNDRIVSYFVSRDRVFIVRVGKWYNGIMPTDRMPTG
jgi:hypothetical protein